MTTRISRRDALRGLGVVGAATILRIDTDAQGQELTVAGQPVELRLASVSPSTVRVSVLPRGGTAADLNRDNALAAFAEQGRTAAPGKPIKAGDLTVAVTQAPLAVSISDASGG